jgi:Protein of unknown function (DUF4232)
MFSDETTRRALSAGLAMLAVAACRGPAEVPASSVAASARSSPPLTQTPLTTTVRAVDSSPAPAPEASTGPRCKTAQLTLRFAGGQAAAETTFLGFQLANTGAAPCLTQGFVSLQMLDATGKTLTTRTVRNGGLFAKQPPPSAFLVHPTAGSATAAMAATFEVAYSHIRKPGELSCSNAFQLQVTPPDELTPLTIQVQGWSLAPCNGGEVDVTPLRPPGVAPQ